MAKFVEQIRIDIATCYGRGALRIIMSGEPKDVGLASLFGQQFRVTMQFLEPREEITIKEFENEDAALDYYLMQIIKHTRNLAEIRNFPQ